MKYLQVNNNNNILFLDNLRGTLLITHEKSVKSLIHWKLNDTLFITLYYPMHIELFLSLSGYEI